MRNLAEINAKAQALQNEVAFILGEIASKRSVYVKYAGKTYRIADAMTHAGELFVSTYGRGKILHIMPDDELPGGVSVFSQIGTVRG